MASPKEGRKRKRGNDDTPQVEDSLRPQKQLNLSQFPSSVWDRHKQRTSSNVQFLSDLDASSFQLQRLLHQQQLQQQRQHANTQFLHSPFANKSQWQHLPQQPQARQANTQFLLSQSTPGQAVQNTPVDPPALLWKLASPKQQVNLKQYAGNTGYLKLTQPCMSLNGLVNNDPNTDEPSESTDPNNGPATVSLKNSALQQKHANGQEILNPESTATDIIDPANSPLAYSQGILDAGLSLSHQRPVSYQPAPSFKYPPLVNKRSSIRLLRIDHGPVLDITGEIYCHLVSLDPSISETKYNCLSYCWGGTCLDKQIFVRTTDATYQSMYITQNLYSALQDLWGASESTFYWIDAICINQTDNAERGEQVRRMKSIYDKASGVVISLGLSTPRLSAAMDMVLEISNQFEKDTHISPDMIVGPSGLQLTAKDLEKLESYSNHPYGEIAHFFSLPWFRRVWVLQEAFSQAKISARLGTRTLPWGSIILAALWQAEFTRSHTIAPPGHGEAREDDSRQYLPELWLSLLHTHKPRGLSMIELTSRARDFKATDPRDKVFSLLGLANDLGPLEGRPLGLVPDYTKSTTEVYANFARAIILKTGKLDVLSLVNTFQGQTKSQNVASWIPHLDAPVATIRGLGFPTKYNASFSTQIRPECTDQTMKGMFVLTLAGFCIDRVSVLTETVMSFSRNLQLYTGDNTDAVVELWRTYLKPPVDSEIPEIQCLQQYIELITAAGFALPSEFPAQPLGRVVPTRDAPSILKDFAAYWARLDPDFVDFQATARAELQVLAKLGDADQFGVLAGKACHERKFFITANGRAGLCPRATQVGDEVVILYGGSVPYVLRKATTDGEWRFIGECYVNGVMFGETETSREKEGERVFDIV